MGDYISISIIISTWYWDILKNFLFNNLFVIPFECVFFRPKTGEPSLFPPKSSTHGSHSAESGMMQWKKEETGWGGCCESYEMVQIILS